MTSEVAHYILSVKIDCHDNIHYTSSFETFLAAFHELREIYKRFRIDELNILNTVKEEIDSMVDNIYYELKDWKRVLTDQPENLVISKYVYVETDNIGEGVGLRCRTFPRRENFYGFKLIQLSIQIFLN